MSRVEVLLDELKQFRVQDSGDIYDDLSTRNARIVLLSILKSYSGSNLSNNLAVFAAENGQILHDPAQLGNRLIRETAQVGLVLADKMSTGEGDELKQFINNLI